MNKQACEWIAMFVTLSTWYIPDFDYVGYSISQYTDYSNLFPNMGGC